MQINANLYALYAIAKKQEVSTNNIANISTDGFKASKAVQTGDQIRIRPDVRAASLNAAGNALSTTEPAEDLVQMTINQNTLEVNITAIQTQSDMENVLLEIKK